MAKLIVYVVDNIDCAIAKLQPIAAARRQSRAMVDAVCHDWQVPHLVPSARTLTSELVDNAMRTQTSGVLKVSLDDLGLRIALRDFRSIEGAELEPGTPAGRALDRVARVSDRCGITPLSDGEILWAVLTNRVAQ